MGSWEDACLWEVAGGKLGGAIWRVSLVVGDTLGKGAGREVGGT